MSKHYNLTVTDKNGKSITTTNVSTEYPEELVRMLTLAGSQVEVTPVTTDCGCGAAPCGCGGVEEDVEYKPTPANDELDLDDFSKKTANSISKQRKQIQPSHGDNPLEYSLDEEEIYDALMSEAQDYGMFTDEGNAKVEDIVDTALSHHIDGVDEDYAVNLAMEELEKLSDEKEFEEADDTAVRENVYVELVKRMARV